MAAVLRGASLSAPGPTSRNWSSRRATWPANRLRTDGGGLIIGRLGSVLTALLSLQPGLHRVLGKEPPAPNSNAPGQVLPPGELVTDGPRLQTQCLGELLDCV